MARARRQPGKRTEKRKMLVLVEGEVTEKMYFEGLCKVYRVPKGLIEIRSAKNPQPEKMIEEISSISKHNNTLSKNSREIKYDSLWVVYDSEGKDWNVILNLIQRAKEFDVNTCVSCSCFEIWLLLHFRYTNKVMAAREALNAVDGCMPGYKETKCPKMNILLPNIDDAVTHAEQLRKYCIKSSTYDCYTDCDRLVWLIRRQGKQ